jgi:FAD/FMN-containing dehydrogenase
MSAEILTSWGRVLREEHEVITIASRFDSLPKHITEARTFLPYGNGRSYGDSCLNANRTILKTRTLDRFISFDPITGVFSCEAGVLLSEILDIVVSQGWFLPVTPGTRFVTVGGAIANDVHGKNHHLVGTFGCHVIKFELLRSDGERFVCSETSNADYFAATIGGLGLTGLITWVQIQLSPIFNPWIVTETIRYESLEEFFALCEDSDQEYSYTASWVDCTSKGKRFGRGLFVRGNHAPMGTELKKTAKKEINFPFTPPFSIVNSATLKAFNFAYYHKQFQKKKQKIQHYQTFFYPLDGVLEWNRLYGPSGFYQYQCIIPFQYSKDAINALLIEIAQSGMGSFLAVLKICGKIQSPGMLSFPRHGVTLALDFPNRGETILKLFSKLDRIVNSSGGRLYPAKDARMPGDLFRLGYPRWHEFSHYIDPHFSSSFWRRMMDSI